MNILRGRQQLSDNRESINKIKGLRQHRVYSAVIHDGNVYGRENRTHRFGILDGYHQSQNIFATSLEIGLP